MLLYLRLLSQHCLLFLVSCWLRNLLTTKLSFDVITTLFIASFPSAAAEPLSLISIHPVISYSQELFKFQAGAQVRVFSVEVPAIVASTFFFSHDYHPPKLRPLWPVLM